MTRSRASKEVLPMAGKKQVLFYINEKRRDRISCDDQQWILEHGNPASARPGRDSGYRGISFVCTRKEILYRVLDEECLLPSIILEHAPDRHRPLITTAVFTGMRNSELRGLTWDNVDFDRRLICVRARANRLNEMGSPKSRAGTRDIPMTPLVTRTLSDWQDECPAGVLGLVFPNGVGNVENYGNIMRRVFYPLQVEAGIIDADGKPKYGFHALRHAAASMMIEQNWPPKKIQTILGHSSITMTFDVYGHLFTRAEDDLDLFDKLEKDLMAA